jgi:hypothetical protein
MNAKHFVSAKSLEDFANIFAKRNFVKFRENQQDFGAFANRDKGIFVSGLRNY